MCLVEWCNNIPNKSGKGYCRTHYDQLRKHGHILNKRTTRNKNDVIIYHGYAEIVLRNRQGVEVARTKIDIEDIDRVREHKWSLNNNGYVRTFTNRKTMYLHSFIMNTTHELDHKDRDKTNNRKSNLRRVTHVENCWNRDSKGKGIRKHARLKTKPFSASITTRGVTKHLGYFATYEEALRARDEAEKRDRA